jgi:SAM-dependent methyltransferase
MDYQKINAKTIDRWVDEGWIWGKPISHEAFMQAKEGVWDVLLTPTKWVPKAWFPKLKGLKVLGLASGGAQQMPIFAANGAICTVLDYSLKQLESERLFAEKEGYTISIVHHDMTKPLPFKDETFDLVFHPVSNVYIETVEPLFKEVFRVLKPGGVFLGGFDNGVNFIVEDEDEEKIVNHLPYNPLKDEVLLEKALKSDYGVQFSHGLEENIGGQIDAGFTITGIYEDTNGEGYLHTLNIPTFYATRSIKQKK